MDIRINGCTITIDNAATYDYYTKHSAHNNCSCTGCKNFRKYIESIPAEVKGFFESVGIIDMGVISEIIPYATLDDGLLFYGGFYHVVGKMTNASVITQEIPCYETRTDNDGNKVLIKTGTKKESRSDTAVKKLSDGFEIMISDHTSLVADDFPEPVLQIDITAHIPWVIDEENIY